jgi:sugar phosphate isomerase/epimerase
MKPGAIGLPTLIERPSLLESVRLCRELSLDFVELNANFPQTAVHALDAEQLRRVAREENIAFTLHLDERLDPCDFNPLLREAGLETIRRACSLAAEAGMRRVTMHMSDGIYITLPDKKPFLYEVYADAYRDALCAFRAVVEGALGGDTLFCIENTAWRPFQRAGVACLLESPAFALCWDTGHDHSAGGVDHAFLMEHERRVAHMHLHDAKGKQNHLPPGDGEVDVAACMRFALERNIPCVLEVKTVEALSRAAAWALRAREQM